MFSIVQIATPKRSLNSFVCVCINNFFFHLSNLSLHIRSAQYMVLNHWEARQCLFGIREKTNKQRRNRENFIKATSLFWLLSRWNYSWYMETCWGEKEHWSMLPVHGLLKPYWFSSHCWIVSGAIHAYILMCLSFL